MSQDNLPKLVKLYGDVLYAATGIGLHEGQIQLSPERFIVVGLKKSKTAEHIEDEDCFEVIVLIKAIDGNYYLDRIEHSADILSPKYIENELNIDWVKKNNYPDNLRLIDDLYTLENSRFHYTLTVSDKPYQIYEKYITYTMSVSYEIWENRDRGVEISPFLKVHCQFASKWYSQALNDLPADRLEYQINIISLLKASIFNFKPFELWEGDVHIDGVEVTLKPNQS